MSFSQKIINFTYLVSSSPQFVFGNLPSVTMNTQATPAAASQSTAAANTSFTSPPFNYTFGSQPPQKPTTKPEASSKLDSKEFSFVLQTKSPGKQQVGVDDVSDDENVLEEENTTYFAPVIPLPDKIEVKTGEEEETVLYSHR